MSNVGFTSNAQQWHDKGFTLQWDYPEAKFVLVLFRNGQKKGGTKELSVPIVLNAGF